MRTTAPLLLYAAALAGGLFLTFRPTWESGFARAQTERGDGMLNHYILEHSWKVVAGRDYRGTVSTPPCFHPEPNTLWYSEHLFGAAPVYWALRLAGVPYDHAYQWWQIVLTGLNFAAFALAVRWLRGPHLLAALGGYLWAFSLIQIDQVKHQQMIPRFLMPLAAYHAWMFVLTVRTPVADAPGSPTSGSDGPGDPLRHLNRMAAAEFGQAVTCVNSGWFLVSGLLTFLVLALALRPGGWAAALRLAWARTGRVALILGGWAAAMILAYVPYFVVNWGLMRGYEECLPFLPTTEAWLTGVPGTVWEPVVSPGRARVVNENWLFCGFGLYALMLAATAHLLATAARRGRPPEHGVILAALLAAGLWVVVTLRVGDTSPWAVVRHAPGGHAIRCVSRVYVTVYLFGTLGAVVWLARVTGRLRPGVRAAALGAVAAWCVAEQVGYDPPSFDKADFYTVVDRAAAELRKGDIGYVVPRYTDTTGTKMETVYGEVLGMWAGLRANVPVVNGYSGRTPAGDYPWTGLPVPDADLRKWLAGKFRGRLVIVDPDDPAATRVIVIE
ncbi:MAG: hypothetical protein C0501_21190 [Isosphaera sp.]|nr:hypothetical protein [Isosphaera sp.]